MIVHIDTIVGHMLAQQGKPYWNKDNRRFGPNMFDCSGIHVAAWRAAGLWYPSWATWSGAQLRWGIEQETEISYAEARRTYGAVLVRGGLNGAGAAGHIVTSLGDGRTMEAMGTAYGCRIGKADGRRFDRCFLVPGVLYRGGAPPAPAIDWAAIAAAVAFEKARQERARRRARLIRGEGMHVARSKANDRAMLFDNGGSSNISPAQAKQLVDAGVPTVDGIDSDAAWFAHWASHDPAGLARLTAKT